MARAPDNRRSTLLLLAAAAATATTTVFADHDLIAGYQPVSDVVSHSLLDLDMQELEAGTDLLTEPGFAAAWAAYAEGGNR